MANTQNLRTPTSEEAKAMQEKSVEARYENKIKRKLIEEAIRKELKDDDLHEIARGIIDRAKDNTYDLIAMRDTLGEKPIEKQENIVSMNNPFSELTVEELKRLAGENDN